MHKLPLIIAAAFTLTGCDIGLQILEGLSKFDKAQRALPIFAYTTTFFDGSTEQNGLVVAHVGPDNATTTRWSTRNTAFAGGSYVIHRKLIFSPTRSHLALSQFEIVNGGGENCTDDDCALAIYDARTGKTSSAMTDNVAGPLVHANCPTPPNKFNATAAFNTFMAQEAAFAQSEDFPNQFEGATLRLIPYNELTGVEGFGNRETVEGMNLIGWTNDTDFATLYWSTDPYVIVKADGDRLPFSDFSPFVETRTDRYLQMTASGTVTSCTLSPVTALPIDPPSRQIKAVSRHIAPSQDAPDQPRSITEFTADGQPMYLAINSDNRYRTRLNTSVGLIAGSYAHALAP